MATVMEESRLLLDKAVSLSARNTGNAGELFKKLMQEITRVRDENAGLRDSITEKDKELATLKSEQRTGRQVAAREKEMAAKQLAAAKRDVAEKERLEKLLATLQADPEIAKKVAVAVEAAGAAGGAAASAASGAASGAGAASRGASAGLMTLSGSPLDVVHHIAGVSASPAAAGAGASPLSAAAASSASPATGAGGAGAAAPPSVGTPSEAVDKLRIASLEKRLKETRDRVDELTALLEAAEARLVEAEETHARAEEGHKREEELLVTNEQLRGQLLSVLQQQESINMYLSLMLDVDPEVQVPVLAGEGAAKTGADGGAAGISLGAGGAAGHVGMAEFIAAMQAAQKDAAAAVLQDYSAATSEATAQSAVATRNVAATIAASKAAAAAAAAAGKTGKGAAPAAAVGAGAGGGVAGAKEGAEKQGAAKEEAGAADTALAVAAAPLHMVKNVGGAAFGAIASLFGGKKKPEGDDDADAAAGGAGPAKADTKAEAGAKDGKKADSGKAPKGKAAEAAEEGEEDATQSAIRKAAASAPADADALKRAVASAKWLTPLQSPELFARYSDGSSAEPAFVPVSMLQHRIFVVLWRNAQFTLAQRGKAAAAAAAAAAGSPASVAATAGATPTGDAAAAAAPAPARGGRTSGGISFAPADLSPEATRELGRIPGLSASLSEHCGPDGALTEVTWDRAVAKALPAAHRGVLLLVLCDRLHLEVGDLVIRLSGYLNPRTLLESDNAVGIQEKLFVALAATVWGVGTKQAEAAIRASLASGFGLEEEEEPAAAAALAAAAAPAAAAVPAPAAAAADATPSAASASSAADPTGVPASATAAAAGGAVTPAAAAPTGKPAPLSLASPSAGAGAASAAIGVAPSAAIATPVTTKPAAAPAATPAAGAAAGAAPLPWGMRRGVFSVSQLYAKAFPVWGVLGAYPEFAPPVGRAGAVDLNGGGTAAAGGAAAVGAAAVGARGTATEISLYSWHAFFARRAALDSAPALLHLLVALRRVLKAPARLLQEPPTLTPLLEDGITQATGSAAALPTTGGGTLEEGGGANGFSLAGIAGAIDGSGSCTIM